MPLLSGNQMSDPNPKCATQFHCSSPKASVKTPAPELLRKATLQRTHHVSIDSSSLMARQSTSYKLAVCKIYRIRKCGMDALRLSNGQVRDSNVDGKIISHSDQHSQMGPMQEASKKSELQVRHWASLNTCTLKWYYSLSLELKTTYCNFRFITRQPAVGGT